MVSTSCNSGASSPLVAPQTEDKVFELLNGEWPLGTPEQVSMDAEEIDEVMQDARLSPQILSLLLIKDGMLVSEYYKEGTSDTKRAIHSVTKSVTSLLIGIAIDQGYLNGSNEPIAPYFPDYRDAFDSPGKSDITVARLLDMTSGLHFPEWTEWNYSLRPMRDSEDWNGFVLGQRMDAKPGELWNYNTGSSQLLAAILSRTTGQSEFAFARERLFGPLRIDDVDWPPSPDGSNTGGFGLKMTARDLAKIGLLVLNRGVWNGKRIVSESWLTESTSRHAAGNAFFGTYGYHWWLSRYAGHEAIFGMGYGGQYLTIVPDLNLVIVLNSAATGNAEDTIVPIPYIDRLVRAVNDG
ncbi:serine hydrolase domain-containing protein [Cohnella sp. GCM10027633]|uniref:serine hydrolase domain-containing protein n=1 Tax=unclassified Cohnella TaxID=2636738 RepID=UPI003630B580